MSATPLLDEQEWEIRLGGDSGSFRLSCSASGLRQLLRTEPTDLDLWVSVTVEAAGTGLSGRLESDWNAGDVKAFAEFLRAALVGRDAEFQSLKGAVDLGVRTTAQGARVFSAWLLPPATPHGDEPRLEVAFVVEVDAFQACLKSRLAAMPVLHRCPVCGYCGLIDPPVLEGGGSSYEICVCCGFQFGFDDGDRGWTYERWRATWIERGMQWWAMPHEQPPPEWDPVKQLSEIGVYVSRGACSERPGEKPR